MQVFLFFLALLCLCAAQAQMDSDDDDDCVLHLKIHKVMPGDSYYRIFSGNEEQARSFAKARWRQLLSTHDSIAL